MCIYNNYRVKIGEWNSFDAVELNWLGERDVKEILFT